MTVPAFTIAQTGHSGSAYTSAVLYASGVSCGHEQWWTLPGHDRLEGLDGDSSWLAVTDAGFRDYPGVVVHQVRHPLACIGSLARHYADADADNPYLLRRLSHVLGIPTEYVDLDRVRAEPVHMAAVTWLAMNRAIARRATLAWRVEAFDAGHVMALAAAAGLPAPDPDTVRVALRTAPRDLNAHGRIGLTWRDFDELVSNPVALCVSTAAAMFGYEDVP